MTFFRKRHPKGTRTGQYRSTLEAKAALQLRGRPFAYEEVKLPYTTEHKYIADFSLPNGILIEVKGYFPSEDRSKMLAVKKAHPEKDIRILFGNALAKLNKNSKTTYGEWATKHGFPYCDKIIPDSWLN